MLKKINPFVAILVSFICASISCSVTGCNDSTADKQIVVNNLQSALLYMNQHNNFTLSIQEGSSVAYHDIIYTNNSMGIESNACPELTNVFYYDGFGTYQINYDGTELKGSEYRCASNIWISDLFPSFIAVGNKTISKLKLTDNDISITDKEYKILFAKLITGDATKMVGINYIYATYTELGVEFNISYNQYSFIYLAHDFGTSSSYTVNDYVIKHNKSALIVDDELQLARDGIKGNNYMQDVYQYGDNPSTTGYVMEYGYHEHYFIQRYKSAQSIAGYISLHAPEVVDGDNPHPALEGIYYYYQDNTGYHLSSYAYNTSTNLIEVMNYPSRLYLWDNLHLLRDGVAGDMCGFTTSGKSYYVTDANVLNDASNNLIGSSFEGQKPTGLVLDIITKDNKIEKFTIYYQFVLSGNNYCYPFPFYSFGKVNNKTLNTIYETYHVL